jgi:ribosome-associated protein
MKIDSRPKHPLPIDEKEIHYIYTRAPGPGGQHVNKVATAVQLRFDVINSPSISVDTRDRLMRNARNRITTKGILIINASRFRSQDMNRRDALNRLADLIDGAITQPKNRHKTKPTLASRKKRIEEKKRRSKMKHSRRSVLRFGE